METTLLITIFFEYNIIFRVGTLVIFVYVFSGTEFCVIYFVDLYKNKSQYLSMIHEDIASMYIYFFLYNIFFFFLFMSTEHCQQ